MSQPLPANPFARFFANESSGGIVLALAALVALVISNSPLAGWYDAFLHTKGTVDIVGVVTLSKPLVVWVNDLWMAIFFFLVGLEIKREFVEGELASRSQALLPALAALGGMAVPAAIYAAVNWGDAVALRGWAIPSATDIAFAIGVVTLLGSRVPLSLKVFLTAVAIIDDLGAIVIIALFYTDQRCDGQRREQEGDVDDGLPDQHLLGVVGGVDEGLEQVDRADADDGGGQLHLQHRGVHVAQPFGLVGVAFQVQRETKVS
jgi:hypothetical protein